MSKFKIDNPLALKSKSDFPQTLLELVKFISLDPEKEIYPVGSSAYKIHLYPGDVDLMENFEMKGTLNEVRLELVEQFQNLVKDILKSKENKLPIFITDFKSGSDNRYDFYMGEVDKAEGVVKDFNKTIVIEELKNLNHQKLIDDYELDQIIERIDLFEDPPNLENFYTISNFIKDLKTVRWIPKEILRGYKELRGGKILALYDALIMNSVVKLDVLAPVEYPEIKCGDKNYNRLSRYTEVTNWFLLRQVDPDTNEKRELSMHMDYKVGVLGDILKYSNPDDPDYNILKAAKRLWAYGAFLYRSKDNESLGDELVQKLSPLMLSYISLLNATKADLENIIIILNNELNVPNDYLKGSLGSIKIRLECSGDAPGFDIEYNTKIIKKLEDIENDKKVDVEKVESAVKSIKKKVKSMTLEALKFSFIDINVRKVALTL